MSPIKAEQNISKGARTRERILDLAEASILEKGFSATSIDELTAGVGITKSGFLYHFSDKTELARQLLKRYLKRDDDIFAELLDRADSLSDDPLHSLLIFFKLFAEMLENLPTQHPGCLAAAVTYQDRLFDNEIRELNKQGMLNWRKTFKERLDKVVDQYPPNSDINLDDVADMVTSLVEGGIVMAKAMQDRSILPRQVLLGRDYVRLIFAKQ